MPQMGAIISELLPQRLDGMSVAAIGSGQDAVQHCVRLGATLLPISDHEEERADIVVSNGLDFDRNPLARLDQCAAATRRFLIVDLPAGLSSHSSVENFLWYLVQRYAVAAVWPSNRRGTEAQSYRFTEQFLIQYLKKLRQDFAWVRLRRSQGRLVAVAAKRRIKRLHILAGVPAIGKSTLLRELSSSNRSSLALELGLDPMEKWTLSTYSSLLKESDTEFDSIVLQYNITSPLTHGSLHRYEYGIRDIVDCADESRVTTMWLPASQLLSRFSTERMPAGRAEIAKYKLRRIAAKSKDVEGRRDLGGLLAGLGMHVRSAHIRAKTARFSSLYGSERELANVYLGWLDFLRKNSLHSDILVQEPDYRIISEGTLREKLIELSTAGAT